MFVPPDSCDDWFPLVPPLNWRINQNFLLFFLPIAVSMRQSILVVHCMCFDYEVVVDVVVVAVVLSAGTMVVAAAGALERSHPVEDG